MPNFVRSSTDDLILRYVGLVTNGSTHIDLMASQAACIFLYLTMRTYTIYMYMYKIMHIPCWYIFNWFYRLRKFTFLLLHHLICKVFFKLAAKTWSRFNLEILLWTFIKFWQPNLWLETPNYQILSFIPRTRWQIFLSCIRKQENTSGCGDKYWFWIIVVLCYSL
jgi:hypothetical protein